VDLVKDPVQRIFNKIHYDSYCPLVPNLGGEGYWIVQALQDAGLVKSGSEARRTIKDGGVYVNNVRATEIDQRLTESDLASETVMIVRKGKRNYALLCFV